MADLAGRPPRRLLHRLVLVLAAVGLGILLACGGGSNDSVVDALPAATVGAHPRILLTPAKLAQLRAASTTTEYADFRNLIDNRLADPAGYSDVGIWPVALLGALTGDARYCAEAIRLADAVVLGDADLSTFASDTSLRGGEILEDVLLTQDWCHAQVSATQKARWSDYAARGVDRMWSDNDTTWPFDDPHNNYWYNDLEGTLLAGVVTEGDHPRAAEFRRLFASKFVNVMAPAWRAPAWAGPGGKEGSHYDKWHRRVWKLFGWWRDATGQDLFARITPQIPEQLNFWMHQITPGRNHLYQWGDEAQDSTGTLNNAGRELMLTMIGLAPGSVEASHAQDLLANSAWADFDRRADRPLNFLLKASGVTPRAISAKPDLYLYTEPRYAGKAFIRSSWDTGASGLSYSYRARWGNASDHDHVDKPGFQWFANGEFVVIDPGFYSASGLPGRANQAGAQVANIVRLAGIDADTETQSPPVMRAAIAPANAATCTAGALDCFYYHAIDATTIWPQATLYRRDYLHFGPDVLIVFDHVSTPGAIDKSWQINTTALPAVAGNQATVTTAANTLRVANLWPTTATAAVRDWRTSPTAGETYSGGFRLSYTDSASDGWSLKVLDIGKPAAAVNLAGSSCARAGNTLSCTIVVHGQTRRITYPADASTPAVIQ
ncbi:hypothetical protein ACWA7J_14535 [Leptothrix sp. BB-4]